MSNLPVSSELSEKRTFNYSNERFFVFQILLFLAPIINVVFPNQGSNQDFTSEYFLILV